MRSCTVQVDLIECRYAKVQVQEKGNVANDGNHEQCMQVPGLYSIHIRHTSTSTPYLFSILPCSIIHG